MALGIGKGTLLGIGYIAITADTADAETSLGKMGIGLAGAATAVLAVGAAAAITVHMANDFNNSMLKIQTQAGGSAADVKVLSNAVLNLSTAQQGPDQLAEALYHLKSVGLDNTTAMKDLKVASDLASVGGSNLEATTNALAGAWRSGIKGAQTFGEAAGTVNAIIGAGNMTMTEFVGAVGTGILPAAKTFGIGLNQVGAALALMTDSGQGAEEAATRLKTSFSLLAAPSATAAKQLATIGLTGLQMANEMRSPAGLVGTIGLLKAALDKSGLSLSQQGILLSKAFGGGKSASTIEALVQNYSVLQGKLVQINKTAGDLPAAVAAQQKTLSAQFAMMKTNLEDFGIKVGEALLPPVTAFVTFLNTTLIPSASRVTTAMVNMIPTKAIQSGLNTLTQVMGSFFKSNFGTTTKAQMAPAMTLNRGGINKSLMPTTSVANPAASMGSQLTKEFSSSFASIGSIASTAFKGIESIMSTGVTVIKAIVTKGLPAVEGVFSNVLGGIQTVVSVGMPIVTSAFKIAANFIDNTVIPSFRNLAIFINPLLQMITPLAHLVGDILGPALSAVGVVLNNVIGPAFRAITGFMAQNKTLITSLAIVFGVLTGGLILLNGQLIIARLQSLALGIQIMILNGASKALTIAQAALDLVMDANPVMLVVIAIAALAAGFYYAWTHSAMFRDIVEDTFKGIKDVAMDVFNFLTHGFGQFAILLLGPIAPLLFLAIHWKATWDVMKSAALAVANWFSGPFVNFFIDIGNWFTGPFVGFFLSIGRWFTGPFVNFFLNIGNWFAGPFVNFFVSAWHVIQSAALGAYNFLLNDVVHPIASIFSWLWTNGIEPALRFIVDGFMNMVSDVLHGASDMLGWVPGVGGKLKSAEKAFDNFRASVNASLGGIQNKTVNLSVDFNNAATAGNKKGLPGLAFGGPVDGPGTGTSDSVLARLSKGEHVWTAAEVQALGGQQAMLNLRQMVKAGRIGKFSVGGAVGVHVSEPSASAVVRDMASWTQSFSQSNAASIYAAITAAAASTGGGSGAVPSGQHLSIIDAALAAAGVPPPGLKSQWEAGMNTLIGRESGWNPNAINLSDCLTLDSMILTRRGWLKHDEVRVGDLTIGYNPDTGTSEWTAVTRVVHYGDAPLIRMFHSRWSATTTPNHRWIDFPRVAEPKSEDPVTCPLCPWPEGVLRRGRTTSGGVRIHLSKMHGVRPDKQVNTYAEVASWVTTEDVNTRSRILLSAPATTPSQLDVSIQEAAVLGWIAGDGHVESRKYGPSMSIAQSKPAMVRKLVALLEGLPYSDYVDERLTRTGKAACGPRHQFRFDPGYAQDLLRRAGHPKTDAVQQVLSMSTEQRAAWLEAMIDAEGHRVAPHGNGKETVSLTQCYGPVLEAIALAVYLSGARPRIRDKHVDQVKNPTWNPSASVAVNGPILTGNFLHKEDAGFGDVWCVTTGLGSWTARDGDHIFLTGNSNAAAGDPSRGLAQTIMSTFDAFVPSSLHALGIYNPEANVAAAVRYIVSRYGNITNVQQANPNLPPKGYDRGGWLNPGHTLAYNGTGRPERVLTADQAAGGGELHVHAHFHGPVGSKHELQNWLIAALQDAKQHGRLRGLIPGV